MSGEREAAMEAYRSSWLKYREALDDGERIRLGEEMDRLQSSIAEGSLSPVWVEFKATLPGFNEFWASTWDRIFANARENKS